jgi:hypothetical protein
LSAFSDSRPAFVFGADKSTTSMMTHTRDHHRQDGLYWAVTQRHALLDKQHNKESKRTEWSWQPVDFNALAHVSLSLGLCALSTFSVSGR